jgi:predicted DNA-binding transcriptional regulator YafY
MMARPDRLFRLLQAMRVMPAPITAARLAEATEVSLRSLYRDIDSLRAAGARIEGERGYGYRLIEDYALPPQTFNRAEIEAIALGLAEVKHMGDLAKVAATLPDDREQYLFHAISQVYRPEPRYAVACDMSIVRDACWREEALAIRYADKGQLVSERTILPLCVMHTDRTLTVLAWCCLREGFRMFRADRITELKLAGTSFRPRRVALLRDHLAELTARSQKSSPVTPQS